MAAPLPTNTEVARLPRVTIPAPPLRTGDAPRSTGAPLTSVTATALLPLASGADATVSGQTLWSASPALLACLSLAAASAALGLWRVRQRAARRLATVPPFDMEAPRPARLAPLCAAAGPGGEEETKWVEKQKEDVPVTAPSGQDEFGYLKYNDPIAAASRFIGRRFGLAGGLAFVGIFAAVEGNEILQALLEPPPQEGSGETITLPSGLQYVDVKVGGGRTEPQPGYLVGAKFKVATADGDLVYDSEGAKPLAFKYGERPFVGLICAGVEEGVRGMRVGSVRRITVPPELGFGTQPKTLQQGFTIPPNTTLVYLIEIVDIVPFYT
eukprot:EG_transcript_15908